MDESTFHTLSQQGRRMSGKGLDAARLVLVHKMKIVDAAKTVGISKQLTFGAVAKLRNRLKKD